MHCTNGRANLRPFILLSLAITQTLSRTSIQTPRKQMQVKTSFV